MIKIERAVNGWILTTEEQYVDDGGSFERKHVFSYWDDAEREDEIKAFIEMLYTINDEMGISYSKYEDYNLKIECEKFK